MKNITEKVNGLVTTLLNQDDYQVSVNLENGFVGINGVEFSQDEQLEILKQYRNDPVLSSLLSQISNSPEAHGIRSIVSFDGGKLSVDEGAAKELLKKTKTPPPSQEKAHNTTNDSKETVLLRRIDKLEKELEHKDGCIDRMSKKLGEQKAIANALRGLLKLGDQFHVPEKDLVFPGSFSDVATITHPDDKVTDQEINEMIEEMKDVDVPLHSFASDAYKDVVIIKTHDDDGIRYYVSRNYHYAYTGESVNL
ncbi:hypothetical protein BXO87_02265 [Bacillus sp. GZB]|uniref:hypothetical protein n=1 Tax=Bacillus TaxID=1386 RepID=UPI000976F8B3|nr:MULTISPECIES: hypothetical protein [Bacillus]MCZ4246950.1 hypothetical protein [Bacillus amyloliquefaciens]OMQ06850.1 hypothetical protein BXO87_02265 [Bacillus sp. GZB]